MEYDTPAALNRCLNAPRTSSAHSSVNSRHLNARGRVFRRGSQLNKRRRRDSTASIGFDATSPATQENNNEDDQTMDHEPRRSLTRVLMETADSLKEAAMMATQACGLAMRKINEL